MNSNVVTHKHVSHGPCMTVCGEACDEVTIDHFYQPTCRDCLEQLPLK